MCSQHWRECRTIHEAYVKYMQRQLRASFRCVALNKPDLRMIVGCWWASTKDHALGLRHNESYVDICYSYDGLRQGDALYMKPTTTMHWIEYTSSRASLSYWCDACARNDTKESMWDCARTNIHQPYESVFPISDLYNSIQKLMSLVPFLTRWEWGLFHGLLAGQNDWHYINNVASLAKHQWWIVLDL